MNAAGSRTLERALAKVRARDASRHVALGASLGALAGAVVHGSLGLVGAVGCIGLGVLGGFGRRSSFAALARRVDVVGSTDDAIACAWDHRHEDAPVLVAQRARAVTTLGALPAARVVPRLSTAWALAWTPLVWVVWIEHGAPSGSQRSDPRADEAAQVARAQADGPDAAAEAPERSFGSAVDPEASTATEPAPPPTLRAAPSAADAGAEAGAPPPASAPPVAPSVQGAGAGQEASDTLGDSARTLERVPTSRAPAQGEPLILPRGEGRAEGLSTEAGAAAAAPRALLPGDDVWAAPGQAHPARWSAVVSRYFAQPGNGRAQGDQHVGD
jgi:hypothetical protein